MKIAVFLGPVNIYNLNPFQFSILIELVDKA